MAPPPKTRRGRHFGRTSGGSTRRPLPRRPIVLVWSDERIELTGAERVQLDTLADNVRAVRFYEHQGYNILALKPDGRPGQDSFSSVRLEKRLRPYRGPVPDGE